MGMLEVFIAIGALAVVFALGFIIGERVGNYTTLTNLMKDFGDELDKLIDKADVMGEVRRVSYTDGVCDASLSYLNTIQKQIGLEDDE